MLFGLKVQKHHPLSANEMSDRELPTSTRIPIARRLPALSTFMHATHDGDIVNVTPSQRIPSPVLSPIIILCCFVRYQLSLSGQQHTCTIRGQRTSRIQAKLTPLKLAGSLRGINKESASTINAFHVFSTRVDNEEYAEVTEIPGISKTTEPYDTHPKQPVNQAEFNPDATLRHNFPFFSIKQKFVRNKGIFFLKRNGLSVTCFTFVFHRLPCVSITHLPHLLRLVSSISLYLFSPSSVLFQTLHV